MVPFTMDANNHVSYAANANGVFVSYSYFLTSSKDETPWEAKIPQLDKKFPAFMESKCYMRFQYLAAMYKRSWRFWVVRCQVVQIRRRFWVSFRFYHICVRKTAGACSWGKYIGTSVGGIQLSVDVSAPLRCVARKCVTRAEWGGWDRERKQGWNSLECRGMVHYLWCGSLLNLREFVFSAPPPSD